MGASNGGANPQPATITDSDLLNTLNGIKTALNAGGRNPLASQPTVTGAKNTLSELLRSLSEILPTALFGTENADSRLPDIGPKSTASEILKTLKDMERYFSPEGEGVNIALNDTVIPRLNKDRMKATENMQLSLDVANKNANMTDFTKLLGDMQQSMVPAPTAKPDKNAEILKALTGLKNSLHGEDISSSVDDEIRRLVDEIQDYLSPSMLPNPEDRFYENANGVQSEIMRMLNGIQQTLYTLARSTDADTLNSLSGVQASLNHNDVENEIFHPSLTIPVDYADPESEMLDSEDDTLDTPDTNIVLPIPPRYEVPIPPRYEVPIPPRYEVPVPIVPVSRYAHPGTQTEILRTLGGIGKSLMRANKFLLRMHKSLNHHLKHHHHPSYHDDDDDDPHHSYL